MVSDRVWGILNISLGIVAVFLVLSLFEFKLPSLGMAHATFDKQDPICIVDWKNEFTVWDDLDSCCFYVRQQLKCVSDNRILDEKEVDWVCGTGKGTVRYWLNNKAYYSCQGLL